VSKLVTLPVDVLIRDWDKEAATKLSPFLLEQYYEKTEPFRQDWAQHQAVYEHSSNQAVFRRHPWRQLEATAASHFLEYQAALWTVFMSLRVGTHKTIKD
jgi:hypothetical protein